MTQDRSVIILEDRADLLVLLSGGRVMTTARTPYTELKYRHFAGNRIMYSFGDNIGAVQETYNDGIFNCTYRDMSMQIRSRDVLAVAILEHMRHMGSALYESLFREEYEKLHQADLMKYMLAGYRDRVRVVTMAGRTKKEGNVPDLDVYIDDGLFKVDAHGNAYVLSFDEENGEKEVYRRICIVAHGDVKEKTIETPVGPVRMNGQTVTTLAKAMFLLEPNLDDSVFTRQLPPFALDELKARKQLVQKQKGATTTTATITTTTSTTTMSVRKLVKAINGAMRRNDTAAVRSMVAQNVENARRALEYLPPRNRFFVKNALAQVTGPGAGGHA